MKADRIEDCPDAPRECPDCPDYDRCDWCGRRLCIYAKVELYEAGRRAEEIWCRPCARRRGWNEKEIATGAVDVVTGRAGDRIRRMSA